ncbi:hypothetical protein PAPYR_5413 [Paratrimastix pyriformis]|uniref:F-box domain-containing protein n=1 Tax=Paratrimastix pyriformis TaxID=342808 RepID=A0ABQ8UI39_9EUKA|nr:hypothetical protein PAPYR_5413 [Paratrimastix pyriformis]
MATSISTLPRDLQGAVIELIDSQDIFLFYSLRKVSHEWFGLVPQCWRAFSFMDTRVTHKVTTDLVQQIFVQCPRLRVLNLCGCKNVNAIILMNPKATCLEELNIAGIRVSECNFSLWAPSTSHLRRLCLDRTGVTCRTVAMLIRFFTTLAELSFLQTPASQGFSHWLSLPSTHVAPRSAPKQLHLLDDRRTRPPFPHPWPRLATEIVGRFLEPAMLRLSAFTEALERVEYSGEPDQLLLLMAACPNVAHLTLMGADMRDADLVALQAAPALAKGRLRTLRLVSVSRVSAKAVTDLVASAGAPNPLRHLAWTMGSNRNAPSSDAFATLLADFAPGSMEALEELHMSHLRLGPGDLPRLAAACPRLRALTVRNPVLTFPTAATRVGPQLRRLALGCPHLESLDLAYSGAIFQLPASDPPLPFRRLRRLNISHTRGMMGPFAEAPLEVVLAQGAALGSVPWEHFTRARSCLRRLDLRHVSMPLQEIETLCSLFPGLQRMQLSVGLRNIPQNQLRLEVALGSLKELVRDGDGS